MPVSDPFDLQRFVDAQEGVYDAVQAELAQGRKTTHWMWFVFPQIRALGRSHTAQHYGIASLDEARAYLEHTLLGPRLQACTRQVLALPDARTVSAVFGSPDDLKFRSCMTLFELAAPHTVLFREAIEQRLGGQRDELTVAWASTAEARGTGVSR